MVFTKRGLYYFIAIDVVLLAVALSALVTRSRHGAPIGLEDFGSGRLRLASPAFDQNAPIPEKYSCQGLNVSPQLSISGVPKGTKSLALVVDDPDAPIGIWNHWVVWNIAPGVTRIAEGFLPAEAVEGATSSGKPGYGGPCPPFGKHRYFFKLYALNDVLTLPVTTDARALETVIAPHMLDKAALVGTYQRK